MRVKFKYGQKPLKVPTTVVIDLEKIQKKATPLARELGKAVAKGLVRGTKSGVKYSGMLARKIQKQMPKAKGYLYRKYKKYYYEK